MLYKTHKEMVKQEVAKFSKEWLVQTEVPYGGYIFDILAINIRTKDIEIVEVDLSNDTEEKKIEYGKTLGKVRIVRNNDKGGFRIPPEAFQPMIKGIDDPMRIAILQLLANCGPHKYSDIMYKLHLVPKKDMGRFAYHLRLLLKNNLVSPNDGKYEITQKDTKILVFFRELMSDI